MPAAPGLDFETWSNTRRFEHFGATGHATIASISSKYLSKGMKWARRF
jgi:hypothetical protein